MARPTKPKDVKPKAVESDPGSGGGGTTTESAFDLKFIVTILVIILVGLGGPAGSVFFLSPMVIEPIISSALGGLGGGEGHGEGHGDGTGVHEKIGMNLELDEFTVNLKSDPSQPGHQYLRTKMSLSVRVPVEEYCDPHGPPAHASLPMDALEKVAFNRPSSDEVRVISGKIVGAAANLTPQTEPLIASGGGGGEDPYISCQKAFNTNMSRFVPTMRDVINTSLMKRTAGNLESIEGQEALKDDIKDQINHLMGEPYGIIRVNFSDFIIQK